MNPAFLPMGRQFLAVFLFSTLAAALGFGLSYQQDKTRVSELGQTAWFHLLYAVELKDDMAVIDWSKNLEKLDNVRAFQAKVNSKITAVGGNQDYLSAEAVEGVSYRFPSDWTFHAVSSRDPQNPEEFLMVVHSWPGPLLWGLFVFLACFTTGAVLQLLAGSFHSSAAPQAQANRDVPDFSKPGKTVAAVKPAPVSVPGGQPFLFIDKHYTIQQATPEAAELLEKKSETLVNSHLLDLAPDPLLIQAIENAVETKLPNPFPAHPHVTAHLKPDLHGSILILKSPTGSETP